MPAQLRQTTGSSTWDLPPARPGFVIHVRLDEIEYPGLQLLGVELLDPAVTLARGMLILGAEEHGHLTRLSEQ